MGAVALTDHGRAGGLLQFKKACDKEEVKPIYGVELYMAPRSRLLREKLEGFNTSYHITVLAKNSEGLKNIFRLTSTGWMDGFYYKPRCLMAGQEILTAEGVKPVEEIQVGDLVVTHRGQLRPVTAVTSNVHEGRIYGIGLNNRYGRTTWVTGDHPVLIYNQEKNCREWVKAKNILPGRSKKKESTKYWKSFVCMPKINCKGGHIHTIKASDILTDTGWIPHDDNTFVKENQRPKLGKPGKHYSQLTETIRLDYNFGFFLGLYASEGYTEDNSVSFSFHKEEKHLAKRCFSAIYKLTGKEATFNYRHDKENYNGQTISAYSTPLSLLLKELCGTLAQNKHLPWFVFHSHPDFQKGIYDGVIAGDGAIHDRHVIFTQTSQALAWQMRILATTFTDSFSSVAEYDDGNPNHHVQYRCNFHKEDVQLKHKKTLSDDNYVYRPVSSVDTKFYSGRVYNIEVEEDHSYVSDFAMHNCDLNALQECSEGLVILSGCSSGFIPYMLMEDRSGEAVEHLERLLGIFGDDVYIEVQNHGIDWQQPLKEALFEFSNNTSVPIVATQDSHFLELEDAEMHAKICKLAAGDLEFDAKELHFKTYEEMVEMFEEDEQHAIHRTNEVAEKCNVDWQFGQTIWPVHEVPEGTTPDEELQKKARQGFKERFPASKEVDEATGKFTRSSHEEYTERLRFELQTIREMGFSTYFLVVAGFIDWAKRNGIPVGPGRGSGAGSLVCYCLGITEIEPIKYGLYFERFLNPARISLPDLDIDFCIRRREEVLSHIVERYGRDRVAQIGTYAAFKPRGSLRDFARVCGYDPGVRDRLAALVPPDIAGLPLTFDEAIKAEPGLLSTKQPEVVELARKAEGLKTKMGIHAAGAVVADRPLNELLPLFRGKHDEVATQFDMHDVEDLGLVKLDLLGLKNLTIIDDAIKLIKKNYDISIDINAIEENDEKVFTEIFQKGDLDGVFQFETSTGFRDLTVQVQPESIDDLSTITALFRPGPLGTGLTNQYVKGRRGTKPSYSTPELKPILGETFGVMVFQEQIMRICVDLAGYTPSEADDMRKAIGKKLKDKMAEHREKFVNGCLTNGIDQDVAEQMFNDIEGFAKYSFNRAHSVAYSVISYQTAWLKYYYPEEFYCALFNNTIGEQDQLVKYIYSCRDRGIPIEPPDVNRSSSMFVVDRGTIIFGLVGIKGIGEKACDHLLSARPERGFESLKELVMAKINAGTLKSLAASGSLTGLSSITSSTLMESLDELIKYYKLLDRWEQRKLRWEAREQEKREAVAAGYKPPRSLPKLPPVPEEPLLTGQEPTQAGAEQRTNKIERLSMERETLGFYLSGHPLDQYPGLYKVAPFSIEKLKERGEAGTLAKLPIVVSRLTKKRTRKGKDMATLILEDRTGRVEGTVFPKTWNKLKGRIEENQVAIALCRVDRGISADGETSVVRLVVNDIHSVSEKDKEQFSKPLITDIEMKLIDGSKMVFMPSKDTNYEQWQKAKAIANNLEKTI